MRKGQVILLLALSLVLVGCGANPTEIPEATQDIAHSPLPTPDIESSPPAESAEATEIPAPSSSAGMVTGFLLSGDPPQGRDQSILFLGKVITSEDGSPVMASINKQSAPKAISEEGGKFVFVDVPPGRYALVLDLITSTVILRHPTRGEDLLIDVTEGEITDLGELVYSDLPSVP